MRSTEGVLMWFNCSSLSLHSQTDVLLKALVDIKVCSRQGLDQEWEQNDRCESLSSNGVSIMSVSVSRSTEGIFYVATSEQTC